MIVYVYNEEKKFTGSTIAFSNPRKLGAFLIPADSTNIEPPTDHSINEWPMFNVETETWSLVESDYKINKDKEDQELVDQQAADARQVELAQLSEVNEVGILTKELIDDEVVDRDPSLILSETNKINGSNLLTNLHQQVETDILNYAKNITKGSSKASIQAFIQAFQLRSLNPSEYINQGLKVYYEITNYPLYSELDNELAITEYYTTILIDIDKNREDMITQYLTAKTQAETAYPEIFDETIIPKFPTE